MQGRQLQLLEVSRDPTPSVLLKVTFADGEALNIRWGLDAESYGPMKRAFEDKFFDSLAEHQTFLALTYEASGPKGDPERKVYAHVEKVSGERRKQINVECSEFFAGNLKWFQESVRTPDDVAHLVVTDSAFPR